MVRLYMSNLRIPITIEPPTIANEVERQTEFNHWFSLCPTTWIFFHKFVGDMKSVQHHNRVSSVVRHVKGSKGHLSQRINCYVSNAGTNIGSLEATTLRGRLADSQCQLLGQRSRSSRWSNDHSGRAGKPLTGQRTLGLTLLHYIQMRADESPYHGESSCST
jgi:hypothetical protein